MADLLSLDAVADELHCSKAHVSNLVNGKISRCSPLPAIHLGRRIMIRRESLERWITENESGTLAVVSPVRGAGKRA
jgi:hypothetical protein